MAYNCTDKRDFYAHNEPGDCERCGCVARDLRYRGAQLVCTNCQEDLDAIAYDARWLFTAQDLPCVACGSTRKTVQSDRVLLNPAAVCCGEVA